MMNFLNPRHWFQKTTGAFSTAQTEVRNRMRYNALFMLDPDVLVRHLAAFAAGDIAGLEHVIDEFESRDDKMKIGAFKMSAAVASKPWEVRINKGEEDNERARLHKEVLTRFWNRIRVTEAFCRNRRGGVRMLVKQMMSAQSRVYAVHDITWKTRGDGELEATFTQIPAWCFENRTGELRYIQDPGGYTGVPMKDGEWLVTVGEGVGVTATVLAMAKRLSWNDWLLFSEKCGMPVILANTGAKQDTPAWKSLEAAVAAIAPKTGLLADLESKIQAVSIGGSSGQTTYRELVETVDRSISSLYRGGDLATMSQGVDGVGSNSQDGESELMDADGCAMVSETLKEQIERHVIRFTCGDFEPLAGIVINPPAETEDIDREIKIDQHLGEFGVKLSKKDMLERYGRTEAASEDDAATRQQAQPGFQGAFNGGFANEAGTSRTDRTSGTDSLLKAFSRDTGPAADAIKELLKNPSKEAAESLLKDLPNLLPEDPALAAVIAEEMALEFGDGRARPESAPIENKLANEGEPTHCPEDGGWIGDAGCTHPNHKHSDTVKKIIEATTNKKPRWINEGDAEKALTEGFYVDVGNGKRIGFGKSLLKHLDEDHPEEQKNDIRNRKNLLMFAVDAVMHPSEISLNEEGHKDRKAYKKAFRDFGIKAISSEEGDKIEYIFTYIPDGKKGSRK